MNWAGGRLHILMREQTPHYCVVLQLIEGIAYEIHVGHVVADNSYRIMSRTRSLTLRKAEEHFDACVLEAWRNEAMIALCREEVISTG